MSGFDQKHNEALIRLLILVKYQDGIISMLEDEDFKRRIADLEWQSGTAMELFVKAAVAEVREAIEGSASRRRYLTEQCSHFATADERRWAREHLEGLLNVDGLGEGESKLLHELAQLLAVRG
jgi:hypothetical protein